MTNKKNNYLPAIEFYDLIAEEYDLFLNQNLEDISIRHFVKNAFLSFVEQGPVIDFGGGTGLDLPWLCENNFKIYFCEPSEKMRTQAKKLNDVKIKSNMITFLETSDTNFHLWNENYPFTEKAHAMLLNFSVLNCIPDINELFFSFSKIIAHKGFVFITALDTTIIGRMKYFYSTLGGNKNKVSSPDYKNKKHVVFRHTLKQIKGSAAKYFSIVDVTPMRKRGLMLVQLQQIGTKI